MRQEDRDYSFGKARITYMIVDENNIIQAGELCGLSREEVERYLEE